MTVQAVTLVVTGAVLLVVEAHVASYGLLGIGGVLAVAAGVILAVDDAGGSAALALALVVPLALGLAVFVAVAGRKALRVHQRRALGGADGLVGRVGVVRRSVAPVGQVAVRGELWRARRSWAEDDALDEGDSVVVEQVDGLTVSVRRADDWEVPA